MVVLFGLFGFSVVLFRYLSPSFVRYSGPCVRRYACFEAGQANCLARVGSSNPWRAVYIRSEKEFSV
jgi:hypothetical protein